MMRPTCAFLPHVLQTGRATNSFGCVGNRVYTDLGDDELYCAIPEPQLERVVAALETIVRANAALQDFHRARIASEAWVHAKHSDSLRESDVRAGRSAPA